MDVRVKQFNSWIIRVRPSALSFQRQILSQEKKYVMYMYMYIYFILSYNQIYNSNYFIKVCFNKHFNRVAAFDISGRTVANATNFSEFTALRD